MNFQKPANCVICKFNEWNPVRYGDPIILGDIQCHYFCLLSSGFSPNLDGSGFIVDGVSKGFEELPNEQCAYCFQYSATVKCSAYGCNKRSYCNVHLPREFTRPPRIQCRQCEICTKALPSPTDPDYNPVGVVNTCNARHCNTGRVHRECIQRIALKVRHNFKCPVCSSVVYKAYAATRGIFVPKRNDLSYDWAEANKILNTSHEL